MSARRDGAASRRMLAAGVVRRSLPSRSQRSSSRPSRSRRSATPRPTCCRCSAFRRSRPSRSARPTCSPSAPHSRTAGTSTCRRSARRGSTAPRRSRAHGDARRGTGRGRLPDQAADEPVWDPDALPSRRRRPTASSCTSRRSTTLSSRTAAIARCPTRSTARCSRSACRRSCWRSTARQPAVRLASPQGQPDGIYVGQAHSPELVVPDGVDAASLRDVLLNLPFLPQSVRDSARRCERLAVDASSSRTSTARRTT